MSNRIISNPELPSQWRAWCIWVAATTFPIYQLAIQIGYGTIKTGVNQSLGLTVWETSLLSSSFLLAYSAMQIPAGLLLDRLSARWLLASAAVICGLAAYGFAHAQTLTEAIFYRSLLGGIAAFGFPGAGLLGRRWINPVRFVLAMGLIDFFFGLGAVMGETGFVQLLHHTSWRGLMDLLALTGISIGILCGLVVRDRPPGAPDMSSHVTIYSALSLLLRTRDVWLCLIFYGGLLGVSFGFGGLWDIPLQVAFGFSEEGAVKINSWMFLGFAISAPIAGLLADRWPRRKPILLFGTLGALVNLLMLLFIPTPVPYPLIAATLFTFGLTLGTSVVIFGIACDAVPPRYSATVIGLVNAGGCLMGALLQIVPGMMLRDSDWHPLHDYQQVLSINVVAVVAALIAVLLLRESSRSPGQH